MKREILARGKYLNKCQAIINKLAEYEDAEENGTLVRLPYKVGDTVYELVSYTGERADECKACVIEGIYILKNRIVIGISDGRFLMYISPHDIGKTIFLTREEAEAAIKE